MQSASKHRLKKYWFALAAGLRSEVSESTGRKKVHLDLTTRRKQNSSARRGDCEMKDQHSIFLRH